MTWTEDASDQKNGYEVLGFQCEWIDFREHVTEHQSFSPSILWEVPVLPSVKSEVWCLFQGSWYFLHQRHQNGDQALHMFGWIFTPPKKMGRWMWLIFSPTPLGVKPQFYPIVSWPFRGQMLYFLRICDQHRHPHVGHITSHSDDLPIKWLVQVGEPIPETNRKISISPKCVACNSSAMGKDVALPLLLPPFHPRDLALCCEFWAKMPQNIDDNGNLTKKNEGISGIHGDYTWDWGPGAIKNIRAPQIRII